MNDEIATDENVRTPEIVTIHPLAVTTTVPEFMTCADMTTKLRIAYQGIEPDMSTKESRSETTEHWRKFYNVRVALDKAKPEAKRELQNRLNEMEADYKSIRGVLKEFEDKFKGAITEYDQKKAAEKAERAEKERLAAAEAQRLIDEKIEAIRDLPRGCNDKSIEEIESFLGQIVAGTLNEETYPAHNMARAIFAKARAVEEIKNILQARIKADAEEKQAAAQKAELERKKAEFAEARRLQEIEAEKVRAELEAQSAALAERQRVQKEEEDAVRAKQELEAEKQRIHFAELSAKQAEMQRQLDEANTAEQERLDVIQRQQERISDIQLAKQQAFDDAKLDKEIAEQQRIAAEDSQQRTEILAILAEKEPVAEERVVTGGPEISTRAALELAVKMATQALADAQQALALFIALPENNVFESLYDASGEIEDRLAEQARKDCDGRCCCGLDSYTQEFIVDDVHYLATLKCEYNRHDKTYYYLYYREFSYVVIS